MKQNVKNVRAITELDIIERVALNYLLILMHNEILIIFICRIGIEICLKLLATLSKRKYPTYILDIGKMS